MKKLLLLLFSVSFVFTIYAGPVDFQRASNVAHNWLSHQHALRGKSVELQMAESYAHNLGRHVIFYVINFEPEGFVMVAGNDAFAPILGYNTTGTSSLGEFPANMVSFFEPYEEAILEMHVKNLSCPKTLETWTRMEANDMPAPKSESYVDPLVRTEWDQNSPWNSECPEDTNGPGGHVFAGCVATAMGQIMKYWEYPSQGTGSHSYTHPVYGLQQVNFGEAEYQWADMPYSFSTPSTRQLLYHLGVSVNMNYGPDGSAANSQRARDAFVEYFDYTNSASLVSRKAYPGNLWYDLLKNHLDNNIPLFYAGTPGIFQTGHAFVCDGYDENGYFHFNWGWGGSYDGFFHLDTLNPGVKDYSDRQRAIINLYPSVLTMPPLAGEGISGNPYRISSLQNLLWIASEPERWGYDYIQTSDIDASATQFWNNGAGWNPIGYFNSEIDAEPFTGSYNGNGFVIDGLYINRPQQDNVGLFGYTDGSLIKNLGVTNVNITGKDNVGALVGVNYCFALVEECYSSGIVNGQESVGGLAGANSVAEISQSYNLATVNGSGIGSGGVTGLSVNSEVNSCWNGGQVNGYDSAGGLVGVSYNSPVNNSYNRGSVSGYESVGGLVGFNMMSDVSHSYSTGAVSASVSVGGLIGEDWGGNISYSYWNTETSGQPTSAGGFARTTEQMTWPHSDNTYVTWDLNQLWTINYLINDGYPFHQWNHSLFPMNLVGNSGNGFVELSWEFPGMEEETLPPLKRKDYFSDEEKTNNKGVFVGFNVYRDYEVINEEPLDEPWYIDQSITNGNYYKYWVTMVFENFESPASNMVYMYPHFPFPVNLQAEAGNKYVLLTWQPPVEASDTIYPDGGSLKKKKKEESLFLGYRVYCMYWYMNIEPIQDTLFLDVEVINHTTYPYYVTAVYSDGESEPSNTVKAMPRAPVPVGLTAEVDAESIVLTWQPPEGIDLYRFDTDKSIQEEELLGYSIYRNNNPLNTTPLTELEYTDSTASHYMLYKYNVKAVYTSGSSLNSNTAEAMLKAGIEPSQGDGSEHNPYQIATLENLNWITEGESRWSHHYIQVANISAFETRTWFDGEGWFPIGRSYEPFVGTYDGQGFIIDGLYIDRDIPAGLFGKLGKRNAETEAMVKNLGVTNVEIYGKSNLGGLAGYVENTLIQLCFSTGFLTGKGFAGGLIGCGREGLFIENSYSNANVFCNYSDADSHCGGFAGSLFDSNITGSYSAGDVVVSQNFAAGFSGTAQRVSINNSYSSGNATGDEYIGGFVGFSDGYSQYQNIYSNGLVNSSQPNTGGLFGYLHSCSSAQNSYWDMQSSGQQTSSGGLGRTAEQMTSPHAANTYVSWSFDEIWVEDVDHTFNNGYPYLQWQVFYTDPVLMTHGANNSGKSTTTLSASIVFTGQSGITAHGFCWNTSGNPSIDDHHSNEGAAVSAGIFSSSLSGLEHETTYYARAYAINDNGVTYGNEVTFHTLLQGPEQFSFIINTSGNGLVNVSGNEYTGELFFEQGTTLHLEAVAAEGWVFDRWSGHIHYLDDPDNQAANMTMPAADISLTAIFESSIDVAEFQEQNISIYPNPASGIVWIQMKEAVSKPGSIKLFNIKGDLAAIIPLNPGDNSLIKMDIKDLKPGVYFFIFEDGQNNKPLKLVIGP